MLLELGGEDVSVLDGTVSGAEGGAGLLSIAGLKRRLDLLRKSETNTLFEGFDVIVLLCRVEWEIRLRTKRRAAVDGEIGSRASETRLIALNAKNEKGARKVGRVVRPDREGGISWRQRAGMTIDVSTGRDWLEGRRMSVK